jgi:hypothetical protein
VSADVFRITLLSGASVQFSIAPQLLHGQSSAFALAWDRASFGALIWVGFHKTSTTTQLHMLQLPRNFFGISFMPRKFDLTHEGRVLEVRIRPIDEAWELWLFEKSRQLALAGVVSIDDVILARRNGTNDPIADAVEAIRQRLSSGSITLPDGRDIADSFQT